jgi:ssDNA-binding Zn-finger/Zn-ribbon topoisomerase 1
MIKSVETSAYWESILEEIAKGENTPETFFEMQKKIVIEIIEEMKEGKYRIESAVGMTYQCPKCNSGLKRVKSLKNGKFYWVCLDKETCKSIYPDNRGKPGEVIEREVVDQGTVAHKCTKCSEALVRKKGQYGFYWQCSLETCKQNYKDDNMTPVEIVKKVIAKDYQCPVCKKGFLVERGKEGKKFWGCSAFPACKTTKKDDGGKPEGF